MYSLTGSWQELGGKFLVDRNPLAEHHPPYQPYQLQRAYIARLGHQSLVAPQSIHQLADITNQSGVIRIASVASVQRKLKQILSEPDIGQREVALRQYAKDLGCSLASTYTGNGKKHLEEELVRRIQEASRSNRETRLWWIAFVSAVASVFSALAAWWAVVSQSR